MDNGNRSIDSLVEGGLIGAALGALLASDQEEGAAVGALLGAAFAATMQAGIEAQKTNLPLFQEEDGVL